MSLKKTPILSYLMETKSIEPSLTIEGDNWSISSTYVDIQYEKEGEGGAAVLK